MGEYIFKDIKFHDSKRLHEQNKNNRDIIVSNNVGHVSSV